MRQVFLLLCVLFLASACAVGNPVERVAQAAEPDAGSDAASDAACGACTLLTCPAGPTGAPGATGAQGPMGPPGSLSLLADGSCIYAVSHTNPSRRIRVVCVSNGGQSGVNIIYFGLSSATTTDDPISEVRFDTTANGYTWQVLGLNYLKLQQHGSHPGALFSQALAEFTNTIGAKGVYVLYESGVTDGYPMTLQAQGTTAGEGGALVLRAGPGTTGGGDVRFNAGTVAGNIDGNLWLQVNGDNAATSADNAVRVPRKFSGGMKAGIGFGCAQTAPTSPPNVGESFLYNDPGNSCRLTVWSHPDAAPHAL